MRGNWIKCAKDLALTVSPSRRLWFNAVLGAICFIAFCFLQRSAFPRHYRHRLVSWQLEDGAWRSPLRCTGWHHHQLLLCCAEGYGLFKPFVTWPWSCVLCCGFKDSSSRGSNRTLFAAFRIVYATVVAHRFCALHTPSSSAGLSFRDGEAPPAADAWVVFFMVGDRSGHYIAAAAAAMAAFCVMMRFNLQLSPHTQHTPQHQHQAMADQCNRDPGERDSEQRGTGCSGE